MKRFIVVGKSEAILDLVANNVNLKAEDFCLTSIGGLEKNCCD
jgi:hypothetical protein